MSLPTIIIAWLAGCLAVTAGWVLLRLCGRLARVENVTGAWRVQPPPRFGPHPAPVLLPAPELTDEEVQRFIETWKREQTGEAA